MAFGYHGHFVDVNADFEREEPELAEAGAGGCGHGVWCGFWERGGLEGRPEGI